jgi:hypothetical protein
MAEVKGKPAATPTALKPRKTCAPKKWFVKLHFPEMIAHQATLTEVVSATRFWTAIALAARKNWHLLKRKRTHRVEIIVQQQIPEKKS